jgi:iron complex outermembrane recepter protein
MRDQLRIRAVRFAVGGVAALATALPVPTVLAQDQTEADEEVVVTGSRIARGSDFESSSPVVTIDSAAIERSGYQNLQQLMEKVPANGNGAFSTRGNNQDSTANGAASISLRGLGADATLVLVNGRRVSISPFAESITTNFVDINAIPVAAIERVEILKDGASALYGSDAVAGVINIVLRKDFEGFETALGFGTADEYDETTFSAIWGLGGEDSNVTMIFDYFKNDSLFNRDRGMLGSADQSSLGGLDQRSSRGYPGRFFVDGAITRDPACPPASTAGQTCVYDFGPFNVLTPEAERVGFMLLARQGLGAVELFAEVGLQHNNSIAQGAPTPLDEGAALTIPVTHPNNPFPGATTLGISRYRTVDAGARQWDIESDNLRGVVGLRGTLSDWDWEASYQRGRGESQQTGDKSQGWVRTDFLQQQIDLGLYNPFGGVQNPQSVIDAITTNLVRRGESNLKMYDAHLNGSLFDMPAGTVRMAAGAEYRDESVSDIPDDQFQRGLIFGTESVSAAGSRDSWAAYVEFLVPVLENLELNIAGRYDDYSDFGDTANPKVALRWAPTDSLAVRGSWGTGFRAPSLAQIGLGPSQESQFFQDSFGCADNPAYCTNTDYTIVFAGNPDLDPEESESFNFGVAWQSDTINVTVDYWDISVEDRIVEAPFGFIYAQNCNNQASTICVRQAPLPGDTLGALQQINSGFVNIGEQTARGVDLGGYLRTPVGAGTVTLGLTYSHLLEFNEVELNSAGTAFVTREKAGEYEFPEDRASLSADWDGGSWGVYASLDHIGSFEDQPDINLDGTPDYELDQRDIDAFTTLNLQFRYTGIENMRFLVGVDNVLDEEPPFAIGDSDTDLYGFVQSQHNPRGMFWNARAIFTF